MRRFIPAVPEIFFERAVAEAILERNPGRFTSETEAIAQEQAASAGDLVEPGILMQHCAYEIAREAETQIARQLKTCGGARTTLPGPIVFFVRGAIRVREIAVVMPAG